MLLPDSRALLGVFHVVADRPDDILLTTPTAWIASHGTKDPPSAVREYASNCPADRGDPGYADLLRGEREDESLRPEVSPNRARFALGKLADGGAHLRHSFLQVFRPVRIGDRQLAPQLPLAQAEQQLLSRRLVDRFGRRPRVELGE